MLFTTTALLMRLAPALEAAPMSECDWCNDKDPLCAQRLCMAHPGMRGCCAGCVTEQLRTQLATVTAERDALRVLNKNNDAVSMRTFHAERAAHAETRAALEDRERALSFEQASHDRTSKMLNDRLESTRAELEAGKHRELEAHRALEYARTELAKAEAALEDARAEVTAADRNGVEIGLRLVRAEARVKELQRECDAWREGCGGVTCG